MTKPLETIQIESAPHPTAAVIWLHGLGADGSDFVPIVREFDLSACPPIRFIFPTAPTRPVTINGGLAMRAWYDITGTETQEIEDAAGFHASQAAINALIDAEKARGIPTHRIILAGFSQGCALTLQTGLRYPETLAGLICLSGYVPLRNTLPAERHAANHHTPIFMGHGRMDPVITIDRAELSRNLLTNLGYKVQWHEYQIPHSVCAEEIQDINRWLIHVLQSA